MAKLKTGIKAPAFSLPDQNGSKRTLADFKESKYTVLYFYPKDMTPGCTIEAQEFTKQIAKFKKLNTAIVGVSGGGVESKQKFCDKHKLKLTLLADEDFAVAKKFGAFGKKSFMGRTYNGILRTTFLINDKGQIAHIFQDVKAEGHADEVLDFLANIGKKFEKGRSAKTTPSPEKQKRAAKVRMRARVSRA